MSNILASSCFLVELHGFEAYLNYFKQLSSNKVKNAHHIGEYWMTQPIKNDE
jgi:hypothetical protein